MRIFPNRHVFLRGFENFLNDTCCRFPINVMFETPASLSFFLRQFDPYSWLYQNTISMSYSCSGKNILLAYLLFFFSDLMHIFKEKSDTKQYFSEKVKQIQQRFPTTMRRKKDTEYLKRKEKCNSQAVRRL